MASESIDTSHTIIDFNSEFINSVDQNTHDFNENDATNNVTEEDEEEAQNYLCIYCINNKVAASYYNVESQIVYYLHDIPENNNYEITSILLNDIKPIKVLVCSKSENSFTEFIRSNMPHEDICLVILPNNDFNYDLAKQLIMELRMPKMKHLKTQSDITVYLNTLINFESQLMIRSLGALLKYLYRNRINVQLERESIKTPVLDLKTIPLNDILLIDEQSMKALQIFHSINHPSVYKQSNKEDTSLFSLFSTKLITKLGLVKLRSWFLKPTRNVDILEKRHQIVEFFMKNENQEFTNSLSKCLKNCKNLTTVFKRMKNTQPNLSDWSNLRRTSDNLLKIYKLIKAILGESRVSSNISNTTLSNDTSFNLFESLVYENINNLSIVNKNLHLIEKIIDFKLSSDTKKIVVCNEINNELDRQRKICEALPEYLSKLSKKELERLKLRQCNIFYIQQQGFLLAIRKENFSSINDNERAKFEFSHNLKFIFNSDEQYYYKDAYTMQLDAKIGDISSKISSLERAVLNELQLLMQNDLFAYAQLLDICAELDVCLAYSKIAKEYNYVKPRIATHRTFIQLKKARHPLMDIIIDRFIPNDVDVGFHDKAKIKILTGPNASGKSIYLKQIGVCVFLTFIGSFVPAQSDPQIGDIDRIYTRINSNDSISSGLSTFSIDLQQIAAALNGYTEKSLILVDEFGKGTLQVDGTALFGAFIRHLLKNDEKIPLTIITTHFHEVLNRNSFGFNLNPNVQFLSFDYLEDQSGYLTYLYNLKKDHIASSSFAINIARNIGVNSSIVSRSQQIYEYIRNKDDIFCYDTQERIDELNRSKNNVQEFLILMEKPAEGCIKIEKLKEFLAKIADERKKVFDTSQQNQNRDKVTVRSYENKSISKSDKTTILSNEQEFSKDDDNSSSLSFSTSKSTLTIGEPNHENTFSSFPRTETTDPNDSLNSNKSKKL